MNRSIPLFLSAESFGNSAKQNFFALSMKKPNLPGGHVAGPDTSNKNWGWAGFLRKLTAGHCCANFSD